MQLQQGGCSAVTVAVVRGCGGGARVLSLLLADFAVLAAPALSGHAEAVGDGSWMERKEQRRLLERRWNGQAALAVCRADFVSPKNIVQ